MNSWHRPARPALLTIPPHKQTWLLALAFVLLWNSGFIGAEYALPDTEPLSLLFWRYWTLALVLFLSLTLRGHFRWPGWCSAGFAMLTGVLAHGVWLGCVFYSLEFGVPAGIVALVVALQPMATGALSGWVTGERTTLKSWLGLTLGFAGVMVAVLARLDLAGAGSALAFFLPFGSVVAITTASLMQRRLQLQRPVEGLSVELALFYQSLGVALAVTMPALVFEGLVAEWSLVFVGAMLWLIFAVSLVAYGLMWMLLARIDATRVASLFYFGPPVTMVMAWAAFDDEILATDLLGLGVVLVGVLLTQRQESRSAKG